MTPPPSTGSIGPWKGPAGEWDLAMPMASWPGSMAPGR